MARAASPQIKIDEVTANALYYIGTATRNTLTSDPSWEIIRITITAGDVDIESPVEVNKGNAIWDDRATAYTYG